MLEQSVPLQMASTQGRSPHLLQWVMYTHYQIFLSRISRVISNCVARYPSSIMKLQVTTTSCRTPSTIHEIHKDRWFLPQEESSNSQSIPPSHATWSKERLFMPPSLALLALLDLSIIPTLYKRRSRYIWVDKDVKPYSPNSSQHNNAPCCHTTPSRYQVWCPYSPSKSHQRSASCFHPPTLSWKVGEYVGPKSPNKSHSNKISCCLFTPSCESWSNNNILMDICNVISAQYKQTSLSHIMRVLCHITKNIKHINMGDVMWWPKSLNQNEHAFFCCILSLIHKAWIRKTWAIGW